MGSLISRSGGCGVSEDSPRYDGGMAAQQRREDVYALKKTTSVPPATTQQHTTDRFSRSAHHKPLRSKTDSCKGLAVQAVVSLQPTVDGEERAILPASMEGNQPQQSINQQSSRKLGKSTSGGVSADAQEAAEAQQHDDNRLHQRQATQRRWSTSLPMTAPTASTVDVEDERLQHDLHASFSGLPATLQMLAAVHVADLTEMTEYERTSILPDVWRRVTRANPRFCDNTLHRLLSDFPVLGALFGLQPQPVQQQMHDPEEDDLSRLQHERRMIDIEHRNQTIIRTMALRIRSFLSKLIGQLQGDDPNIAIHACRELGERHAMLRTAKRTVGETSAKTDVSAPQHQSTSKQRVVFTESNSPNSAKKLEKKPRQSIVKKLSLASLAALHSRGIHRQQSEQSIQKTSPFPIPTAAWIYFAECFNREMHVSLDTTDVGEREMQLLAWKAFIESAIKLIAEAYQEAITTRKREENLYSIGLGGTK